MSEIGPEITELISELLSNAGRDVSIASRGKVLALSSIQSNFTQMVDVAYNVVSDVQYAENMTLFDNALQVLTNDIVLVENLPFNQIESLHIESSNLLNYVQLNGLQILKNDQIIYGDLSINGLLHIDGDVLLNGSYEDIDNEKLTIDTKYFKMDNIQGQVSTIQINTGELTCIDNSFHLNKLLYAPEIKADVALVNGNNIAFDALLNNVTPISTGLMLDGDSVTLMDSLNLINTISNSISDGPVNANTSYGRIDYSTYQNLITPHNIDLTPPSYYSIDALTQYSNNIKSIIPNILNVADVNINVSLNVLPNVTSTLPAILNRLQYIDSYANALSDISIPSLNTSLLSSYVQDLNVFNTSLEVTLPQLDLDIITSRDNNITSIKSSLDLDIQTLHNSVIDVSVLQSNFSDYDNTSLNNIKSQITQTLSNGISLNQDFTTSSLTIHGDIDLDGDVHAEYINATAISSLVTPDTKLIVANVSVPTNITANNAGLKIKGSTNKLITYNNASNSFISNVPIKTSNIKTLVPSSSSIFDPRGISGVHASIDAHASNIENMSTLQDLNTYQHSYVTYVNDSITIPNNENDTLTSLTSRNDYLTQYVSDLTTYSTTLSLFNTSLLDRDNSLIPQDISSIQNYAINLNSTISQDYAHNKILGNLELNDLIIKGNSITTIEVGTLPLFVQSVHKGKVFVDNNDIFIGSDTKWLVMSNVSTYDTSNGLLDITTYLDIGQTRDLISTINTLSTIEYESYVHDIYNIKNGIVTQNNDSIDAYSSYISNINNLHDSVTSYADYLELQDHTIFATNINTSTSNLHQTYGDNINNVIADISTHENYAINVNSLVQSYSITSEDLNIVQLNQVVTVDLASYVGGINSSLITLIDFENLNNKIQPLLGLQTYVNDTFTEYDAYITSLNNTEYTSNINSIVDYVSYVNDHHTTALSSLDTFNTSLGDIQTYYSNINTQLTNLDGIISFSDIVSLTDIINTTLTTSINTLLDSSLENLTIIGDINGVLNVSELTTLNLNGNDLQMHENASGFKLVGDTDKTFLYSSVGDKFISSIPLTSIGSLNSTLVNTSLTNVIQEYDTLTSEIDYVQNLAIDYDIFNVNINQIIVSNYSTLSQLNTSVIDLTSYVSNIDTMFTNTNEGINIEYDEVLTNYSQFYTNVNDSYNAYNTLSQTLISDTTNLVNDTKLLYESVNNLVTPVTSNVNIDGTLTVNSITQNNAKIVKFNTGSIPSYVNGSHEGNIQVDGDDVYVGTSVNWKHANSSGGGGITPSFETTQAQVTPLIQNIMDLYPNPITGGSEDDATINGDLFRCVNYKGMGIVDTPVTDGLFVTFKVVTYVSGSVYPGIIDLDYWSTKTSVVNWAVNTEISTSKGITFSCGGTGGTMPTLWDNTFNNPTGYGNSSYSIEAGTIIQMVYANESIYLIIIDSGGNISHSNTKYIGNLPSTNKRFKITAGNGIDDGINVSYLPGATLSTAIYGDIQNGISKYLHRGPLNLPFGGQVLGLRGSPSHYSDHVGDSSIGIKAGGGYLSSTKIGDDALGSNLIAGVQGLGPGSALNVQTPFKRNNTIIHDNNDLFFRRIGCSSSYRNVDKIEYSHGMSVIDDIRGGQDVGYVLNKHIIQNEYFEVEIPDIELPDSVNIWFGALHSTVIPGFNPSSGWMYHLNMSTSGGMMKREGANVRSRFNNNETNFGAPVSTLGNLTKGSRIQIGVTTNTMEMIHILEDNTIVCRYLLSDGQFRPDTQILIPTIIFENDNTSRLYNFKFSKVPKAWGGTLGSMTYISSPTQTNISMKDPFMGLSNGRVGSLNNSNVISGVLSNVNSTELDSMCMMDQRIREGTYYEIQIHEKTNILPPIGGVNFVAGGIDPVNMGFGENSATWARNISLSKNNGLIIYSNNGGLTIYYNGVSVGTGSFNGIVNEQMIQGARFQIGITGHGIEVVGIKHDNTTVLWTAYVAIAPGTLSQMITLQPIFGIKNQIFMKIPDTYLTYKGITLTNMKPLSDCVIPPVHDHVVSTDPTRAMSMPAPFNNDNFDVRYANGEIVSSTTLNKVGLIFTPVKDHSYIEYELFFDSYANHENNYWVGLSKKSALQTTGSNWRGEYDCSANNGITAILRENQVSIAKNAQYVNVFNYDSGKQNNHIYGNYARVQVGYTINAIEFITLDSRGFLMGRYKYNTNITTDDLYHTINAFGSGYSSRVARSQFSYRGSLEDMVPLLGGTLPIERPLQNMYNITGTSKSINNKLLIDSNQYSVTHHHRGIIRRAGVVFEGIVLPDFKRSVHMFSYFSNTSNNKFYVGGDEAWIELDDGL